MIPNERMIKKNTHSSLSNAYGVTAFMLLAPERHHSASRGPSLDKFIWCDCSQSLPRPALLLTINRRHVLHQIAKYLLLTSTTAVRLCFVKCLKP